MFSFGDQIVLREQAHGKIWTAKPVTVVRDDEELLVFYMAPGTTMKYPKTPNGAAVPAFLKQPWILVDETWAGGGALYISRPRSHYCVAHFWKEGFRETKLWYVNLQLPFVRTKLGFDYLDQALDIRISADLKTWQWKDVVEFEELQEDGVITRDDGDLLREVGLYVIRNYQNDKLIFNEQWPQWRPPENWKIPKLPQGWDTL